MTLKITDMKSNPLIYKHIFSCNYLQIANSCTKQLTPFVLPVLPVIAIVTVLSLFVRITSGGSLFGAIGFLILFMLPIAIISSRIMWKKGIIKVVDNEEMSSAAKETKDEDK